MNPSHLALLGRAVLVTGGAGAIGSNLTRRLLELGASVTVIDDFSAALPWSLPPNDRLRVVRASILDDVALETCFTPRPEIVFHLAAFFANQRSVEHPETDLLVNGLGTLRVLRRAQRSGVDRVVYASSSSSFYGPELTPPFEEDTVSLMRTTPYQISKLLGELYCGYFHRQAGLPTVALRFFNSYGPGEPPGRYRNVIPNFVYRALRGLPLQITGTGDETRDFTYVDDLVDGTLAAATAEAAPGGEFNLASGVETRVIELAEMVNAATGSAAGIETVPRRAWDTSARRLASIERSRKVLGYEPRTTLSTGLAQTIAWFRENLEGIDRALAGEAEPVSYR